MSLGFTVGYSGHRADLVQLVEVTERLRGVYTGPPPGALGGGRRQRVAGLRDLAGQAAFARDRGLRFEVTLNGPDVASGDDGDWWRSVEADMVALEQAGVSGLILSHPLLLSLAKERTGLAVTVSTIAEVASVREARWWVARGADALVPSVEVNKRPEVLGRLRKHLPALRLTLMVNEHCLGGCPWRAGHYLCTAKGGRELDYHLQCKTEFRREPWMVLANNAIRPEDVNRYAGLVDELKVLGRTDPIDVLVARLRAYDEGRWAGNYVALLDPNLARYVQVPNEALDELLPQQWACDFTCQACRFCERLYNQHGRDRFVRRPQTGDPE